MTTLSELIELSTAFSAEIDLSRDFRYNLTSPDDKIEGYLPNQGSRGVMRAILDTLTTATDRKVHLIQASYGTGKSYLLLVLAHLLGNNDPVVLESFLQKVIDKDSQYNDRLGDIVKTLTEREDRFLVVLPSYGDVDFKHALLQGLITALDKQGVDYRPATVYNKAADVLTKWKQDKSSNFDLFKQKLTNKSIDDFIDLLRQLDADTYRQFKTDFQDIVGNAFAETDTTDVYAVFAQTAKYIATVGYRGIVICYDEFGDVLARMINQSEGSGLAVQDFLQNLKRPNSGANILFLAATHQNPEALRENKAQDISKIIGRFTMHRLGVTRSTLDEAADAEIADATEIIGTVFIHPPARKLEFDHLLTDDHRAQATRLAQKHKLYPGKTDQWIEENVLGNLHPLHVLTSRLLPKLSNEFAQNTRSMFNFLSPAQRETGGLQHFLRSQPARQSNGQPTLFTLDHLLDFFEPNLRDTTNTIKGWYEDYRTAVGKVTGKTDVERLFRTIIMLKVVRDNRLAPSSDLLFWAMNWSTNRRSEFDSLLATLSAENHLEYYEAEDRYDFPASGTLSIDTVIKEERDKAAGLVLNECLPIWEGLESRPQVRFDKSGQLQRWLKALPAHRLADIVAPTDELVRFYEGKTDVYEGSGLVFYLIDQSPESINSLVTTGVKGKKLTLPYTFYATPKDVLVFDALRKRTIEVKAREAALDREEIKTNAARRSRISEQLEKERNDLRKAIKSMYEPINWNWYYADESTPQTFTNPRHLDRWVEQKVEELFTLVPAVKDEALEFVKRSAKKTERQNALTNIITAERNRIEIYSPSNAADDRVVRNFFRHLSIKSEQRVDKKQYGDVKSPDAGTPEAAIFKHFDKALKVATTVNPQDLFVPLLQAPYGLSEHLIKFFFVCYCRLNDTQVTIWRGNLQQVKDPALFENLFNKPGEYRLRYVALTGPEERYLRRLRDLFDKKSASSFGDVARQFQGVWNPLSALQRTLIQQKGGEVSSFYETINELGRQTTVPEVEARTLFLDTIPNSLLGITSQTEFEDDPANLDRLEKKLQFIKAFPETAEQQFKLETLRKLAEHIFGASITEKEDIKAVVKNWFDGLPSANRIATHENPKLNEWLKSIQYGTTRQDTFSLYLSDLPSRSINSWDDNLVICQSAYIDEFKAYKKAVEEFTRPVLPVYQAIARGVFEVTAGECATEDAFLSLFQNWWNELPQLTQNHTFEDTAVDWLKQNITSTAPPKQTFLDVIPRRWLEKGCLPATVPAEWDKWTDSDVRAVANQYRQCVEQINDWKPPVTEADFFHQLGQLFGASNTHTADTLRQWLLDNWYTTLPERTQQAGWAGMNDTKAEWMVHLKQGDDFYTFVTEILPQRYGLLPLRDMDDDILVAFLRKIEGIKQSLEAYRRPLTELLGILEKQVFGNEAEFKNEFYETIRKTDAFNSKAETDNQLLGAQPFASLVLRMVRQGKPVGTLVQAYAAQMEEIISDDNHQWSGNEQKAFIKSLQETKKMLIAWRFPEDKRMADARAQVEQQIQQVCDQFGLTAAQRTKILHDLLTEQPTNIPA